MLLRLLAPGCSAAGCMKKNMLVQNNTEASISWQFSNKSIKFSFFREKISWIMGDHYLTIVTKLEQSSDFLIQHLA